MSPDIVPEGVVSVNIDPATGLLAHPEQNNAIFEYFREDNVPTEIAIPETLIPSGMTSSDDASNAEVSALSGGIGMFSRIAEHADIYGLVSYETLDRKVVDKDSGYAIELGLRWATSSRLELDAGARYLNLDDSPDEVIWFGGLAVQLSPAIALTAQYSQGDDDRRYTAGLRFFSTE